MNNTHNQAKGSRLQGVLLILAALLLGYLSIFIPLQQAHAGALKISWASEFAFLSPSLALLGVLAFFFPSMTTNDTFLLKAKDKLSIAGWILLAALVTLGAGTYYFVNHELSSLGYTDTQLDLNNQ